MESAAAAYAEGGLKGEIVLVIEGKPAGEETYTLADALTIAAEYVESGMSINEAAKQAAKETKVKKSEIYKKLTEN